MSKQKCKKKKSPATKASAPKKTIAELITARDGGQIALKGYSYQLLYSCYLILSTADPNTSFGLEGIEDIDRIECTDNAHSITHIQLKCSQNKQNASFMKDILKNFLETYLLDSSRSFKLIYDFPVANGDLKKLLESNLDEKSCAYWDNVVAGIKGECTFWDWSNYNFKDFFSKLKFEKISRDTLEIKIEKALIETYDIATDNLSLFANSIKILCLEKMTQREYVTHQEIAKRISEVKIDISKGPQNPAHSWIRRVDYSKHSINAGHGFFEGKKATPADIASGLPVHRPELEREIADSVNRYTVTVIKASSGQGKTTLALQTAFALQDTYTPYQLTVCNDIHELGNIVQWFNLRIELGEKPLIILDNLDTHLSEWNELVQLMQTELVGHYKLLITSREIDWYNYGGDLSNIQSLHVIRPTLGETEALAIYNLIKESGRLHSSVTDWRKAWHKIAEKQLLIEYVYLLTHGEMLSERISAQMAEIGASPTGGAKCEILRKVCFADLCGIRLTIQDLWKNQTTFAGSDFGELLKSMNDEFLVHVNVKGQYIEGLHPIRSKHIVDQLHEFFPIDETALSVIQITKKDDFSMLFSHIPEFEISKDCFARIAGLLWDESDLSDFIDAIRGLFSGSVARYYIENRMAFDDANAHGGLSMIAMEVCPFAYFPEFDVTVTTLDKIQEIFPENENITYLRELRDRIPSCNLHDLDIYYFCNALYKKMQSCLFSTVDDRISYILICEWLYNIDNNLNLSANLPLNDIWQKVEEYPVECVSSAMYCSFCGNREKYSVFVEANLDKILRYLKHHTNSHRMYIESERSAIHVEYILRLNEIKKANDESVSRLKIVCKTLPIFDLYCADAIKPTLNMLSAYQSPDDAHKEMPLQNIAIMFHQNLTTLWNKTILSYYEFDTIAEWIAHWLDIRDKVCVLADCCCSCMQKLLSSKPLGNIPHEFEKHFVQLNQMTVCERRYPKEDRPFEEKPTLPEGLSKIKSDYFQSMNNFFQQFTGFLKRNNKKQRLAVLNLKAARSALKQMQLYFSDIACGTEFYMRHTELCIVEMQNLDLLLMNCSYYQTHYPNKYFNKYQVKVWYEESLSDEMSIVKNGISQLQLGNTIYFPDRIYTIGILSHYPLIIENLDITSGKELAMLFIGCIPFLNSSFDYVVVMFTDENKRVNPTALKIPRRMIEKIKTSMESENEMQSDNLSLPYPTDVTEQMLECFHDGFTLQFKRKTGLDLSPISEIAEELWIYSKLIKILVEPEDSDYLRTSLESIQKNIFERLRLLADCLPPEDIHQLSTLCESVFSGTPFDDNSFNVLVESLVSSAKSRG